MKSIKFQAMGLILLLVLAAGSPAVGIGKGNGNGGNKAGGSSAEVIFKIDFTGHPGVTDFFEALYLPTCSAASREQKGPGVNYTAWFSRHDLCATVTTSTGATLKDDIVVTVFRNEFGDIVAIQLTGQDVIGTEGIVHETDVIALATPLTPSNAGFVIHVDTPGIQVWKLDTHVRKPNSQRVEMVGTISIGDMVYTPNP